MLLWSATVIVKRSWIDTKVWVHSVYFINEYIDVYQKGKKQTKKTTQKNMVRLTEIDPRTTEYQAVSVSLSHNLPAHIRRVSEEQWTLVIITRCSLIFLIRLRLFDDWLSNIVTISTGCVCHNDEDHWLQSTLQNISTAWKSIPCLKSPTVFFTIHYIYLYITRLMGEVLGIVGVTPFNTTPSLLFEKCLNRVGSYVWISQDTQHGDQ